MKKTPSKIILRLLGFTIWHIAIILLWCVISKFQIGTDIMVCVIIPRCTNLIFAILSTFFIRKPWAYKVNLVLFLLPEFCFGFLLTVAACFMAGPFGIIAPIIVVIIVSVVFRTFFNENIRAYFGFNPKE
jgi:hypothetical protein